MLTAKGTCSSSPTYGVQRFTRRAKWRAGLAVEIVSRYLQGAGRVAEAPQQGSTRQRLSRESLKEERLRGLARPHGGWAEAGKPSRQRRRPPRTAARRPDIPVSADTRPHGDGQARHHQDERSVTHAAKKYPARARHLSRVRRDSGRSPSDQAGTVPLAPTSTTRRRPRNLSVARRTRTGCESSSRSQAARRADKSRRVIRFNAGAARRDRICASRARGGR